MKAAELKKLKAEAARYRFLRDHTCNMHYEIQNGGGWKTMRWHMNLRGDNPAWLDSDLDREIGRRPSKEGDAMGSGKP